MKKRLLVTIICCILSVSIIGCGSSSTEAKGQTQEVEAKGQTQEVEATKETEPNIPETNKNKHLGDKVGTDIFEFILNNAELTFYANAPELGFYSINGGAPMETLGNPEVACLPAEKGQHNISSKKGSTILCLDYVLTNTDRDKTDADRCKYAVLYNGEEYVARKDDSLNASDAINAYKFGRIDSIDGIEFSGYSASNQKFELEEEETKYYRDLWIVDFEPDNLTDSFDLIISIPNSSGEEEKYMYHIN